MVLLGGQKRDGKTRAPFVYFQEQYLIALEPGVIRDANPMVEIGVVWLESDRIF